MTFHVGDFVTIKEGTALHGCIGVVLVAEKTLAFVRTQNDDGMFCDLWYPHEYLLLARKPKVEIQMEDTRDYLKHITGDV